MHIPPPRLALQLVNADPLITQCVEQYISRQIPLPQELLEFSNMTLFTQTTPQSYKYKIDPETLKYVFVSLMIKSLNEERLVEFFANLLTGDVYVIESVDGRVILSMIQTLQALAVLRLFFIVLALSVLHGLDDEHVCVSFPDSLTQQSRQLTSKKPIEEMKIRSIMMIIGKFL
ncbi:MAG: hypothetical protein EZS28_001561 [Streblomastix strix]|uniref:Uncharacterized protein n=1 Tax=Streblomastix strix TaxID=222440 RepID=A0A5J4X6U1_9EUKA|nr:MAG: hypothetical protein EZS28_001561 [Streblomastix strix]